MTITKEERAEWRKEHSSWHGMSMGEDSEIIVRLLDALESTEQTSAEFEGQAERYSQEFACAERQRACEGNGMMLTEDEAKNKACCKCMPHKEDGKLMTAACLASGCMAWRIEYGTWHLGEERFLVEGDTYQRHEAVQKETGYGYCGLAGRPE